MYLFETGFGQAGEQGKGRQGKRVPKDRQIEQLVKIRFDLDVPFRKEYKDFRQEVLKAIGRHVAASEQKKIASLMDAMVEQNLKEYHKYYAIKVVDGTANPNSVLVPVGLYGNEKERGGLIKGLVNLITYDPPQHNLYDVIGPPLEPRAVKGRSKSKAR